MASSDNAQTTVHLGLKLLDNYVFEIDFGDFGKIITDEPEPLGQGEGPNPSHLLAASIANCLAASLMFAVRKFKGDPGALSAQAELSMHRVNGRLRVKKTDVTLQLGNAYENLPHIDKVLAQFEEFCVVTQSVREGFEVNVEVRDLNGDVAKP
ncbi:hypothetical protein A3758_02300 [Oleiphilus sp. HI0118]|uniref:OsmC family protein n=1 Tax=Oleiphilus sp. HI0079 TaxID=1822254 RepID=UPI0007C40956|nr:OsmC family protein [Oleiphilus sp. HI0079]KZZ13208.1 hypothetical protein A3750_04035 [Oleiphilus sp. HI0079]KZZ43901.1 hypothetical protein A3758_19450 [Oleiphilus sp. HI0118]KZZ44805.1 hypothetical protein A3758_02300 [Oleiphilus sp. HI0118]